MPNPYTDLRLSLARLSRRMRQQRAEGDVGEGQRSVLFRVHDAGPQTLGALAEHDRVTPPSMNRTVGVLVERGYLTREQSTEDARRVSIDLTDAGRQWVRETRRRRDAWFAARIGSLTAEERDLLERVAPVLRKLADA